MGFFDVFTNKNASNAANSQIAATLAGINANNAFSQSGRDMAVDYTKAGINSLNSNYASGRSALNTNFAAGLKPWQTNFDVNNSGQQLYADALGVNGPEGQERARQTFQAGPGYQWMLDQGNENILRNAARTGSPQSGGTNVDLLNYGQGLANQQWQNWLQTLQPYTQASNTSAAGVGNLYSNLGTSLANNYQGLGSQTNQTYANLGSQLLQSLQNQGAANYGAAVSQGNALANSQLANNTASQNMWNAILSGGKMIAGSGDLGSGISNLSSGLGLGNAATALFGMFSDERLKTDIEPVGALFDGQMLYRYRYKGDPRTQIGLLAHEVEDRTPEAVFDSDLPGLGEFKMVDYHTATNRAAELMRMAA